MTIREVAEYLHCEVEDVQKAMNGEFQEYGVSTLPSMSTYWTAFGGWTKTIRQEHFDRWLSENRMTLDLALDPGVREHAVK